MTKTPRLSMLRPRVSTLANRLAPGPKVKDPVYSSPEWRHFIAAIIGQRGRRCQNPRCQTPNRGAGQRIFGDHIIELCAGGMMLDDTNVQLLCSSCHVTKTIAERKKRMETKW